MSRLERGKAQSHEYDPSPELPTESRSSRRPPPDPPATAVALEDNNEPDGPGWERVQEWADRMGSGLGSRFRLAPGGSHQWVTGKRPRGKD